MWCRPSGFQGFISVMAFFNRFPLNLWFMLFPISARTSGRPRILMHVDVDRASPRDAFFAVQVCGFRGDLSLAYLAATGI